MKCRVHHFDKGGRQHTSTFLGYDSFVKSFVFAIGFEHREKCYVIEVLNDDI